MGLLVALHSRFCGKGQEIYRRLRHAQLKLVDTVESLPNYENRKAEPVKAYEEMQEAREALLNEWQFLKGYATGSFCPPCLR